VEKTPPATWLTFWWMVLAAWVAAFAKKQIAGYHAQNNPLDNDLRPAQPDAHETG
jgi:hypothetical protein